MVGVGIVGTGFMSWVHAEAIRRVHIDGLKLDLVGVCGSSAQKAQQAAESLQIARGFDSYESLLASDAIDVVHIVSPNHLHHSMVKQAIAAGKHVMCEKPLAITSEETSELADLAAANNDLVCGVNYNIRFYPLCIETASRVADGSFGEIFHVNGSYIQDWLLYPTDYNWRVVAESAGPLRAVADIGTHWLDLAQNVVGQKVVTVCATLKTFHPTRQKPQGEVKTFSKESAQATEPIDVSTDDYGAILLRFENGATGSVHVSQVAAGHKNSLSLQIAGSKQSSQWNSERPNELWIGHRDQPNETLTRDPGMLSPQAALSSEYPGGHNEGFSDTFKQCFSSFYQRIAGSPNDPRWPFASFRDGHHEALVCEAVLKSARQGCWVDV